MRKPFSNTIEKIALNDERVIFITGDLGYNAFENLQEKLGERFINAGVAEQNMISMAAGMAYKGYKVFCYSIAPFVVFRALEQFRNDVCFHQLPVFMVGNGGGYGYGIMGSSHHALEDIACLSGLPNCKCWIPAFGDDVEPVLNKIVSEGSPAYLRLGLGLPSPEEQTKEGSFNSVLRSGDPKATIVALGPIVNNVLAALKNQKFQNSFDLFTAVNTPLEISKTLKSSIEQTGKLIIVEEHISTGGIGQQLTTKLFQEHIYLKKFASLHALGYPDKTYGDQSFHQKQSGLDSENISGVLNQFL